MTAPDYESLMEQQKILSNTELFCLVEMTECMEELSKKEKFGFEKKEEKERCIKDFLTAYHVAEFYDETEYAGKLKKHIGERYGWQYIG